MASLLPLVLALHDMSLRDRAGSTAWNRSFDWRWDQPLLRARAWKQAALGSRSCVADCVFQNWQHPPVHPPYSLPRGEAAGSILRESGWRDFRAAIWLLSWTRCGERGRQPSSPRLMAS